MVDFLRFQGRSVYSDFKFLPSWIFFARPAKKNQQSSIKYSHINHSSTKHSIRFNVILVGGFNPFEKYDRQNGFIFRKNQMNTTKNWSFTTQYFFPLFWFSRSILAVVILGNSQTWHPKTMTIDAKLPVVFVESQCPAPLAPHFMVRNSSSSVEFASTPPRMPEMPARHHPGWHETFSRWLGIPTTWTTLFATMAYLEDHPRTCKWFRNQHLQAINFRPFGRVANRICPGMIRWRSRSPR